MKVGIMQPYLLSYIGYYQLIACVDKFVIYDSIEYTKKGWINRNRILVNGRAFYFTIPLKKDSDYAHIISRNLAENKDENVLKILSKIENAYRKAPFFEEIFPILKMIFFNPENNLFRYIKKSIEVVLNYLDIKTEIVIASTVPIEHSLRSKDRVIAICKELKADHYINPIGGTALYSKIDFLNEGIILNFLRTKEITYKQFENEFVPFLSIIDVLMFNSKEEVQKMLNSCELI